MAAKFMVTRDRGVHVTLSNGWSISVQWGTENYCSHHWEQHLSYMERYPQGWESPDAEFAVWHGSGGMITLNGDTVSGYNSPDQVARLLGEMVTWPSDFTPAQAEAAIQRLKLWKEPPPAPPPV